MNWINARDRLPENDRCVLVIVNGTHGNGTWMDAYELASYYPEGWFFDSIPDYEPGHGGLTVTHWMPLPDKPRDKPTNGDRIRGMDDEELVQLLVTGQGGFDCSVCKECDMGCATQCADWLQQPAEVNDDDAD